jgi:hypothetical protein
MIYGSVCSGIEAATVAWHPLGWEPAFFSEIEPFPRAVLQHHYPNVPLHGDFTTIEAGQYAAIDLLVGGTPCQDFSIAGLRAGLDGDRGNLSLEYLKLVDRLRPRWVVWEYPKDAGVCSLSDILETGALPPQYYLSAKACQGILRRAVKRERMLPSALQAALEAVAMTQPPRHT